ncbi:MAG: hypothetical protein GX754_01990, partial [Clostridiaceae bacterium]|nr:hypothetical protein [Clostridiaceae bacterium]
MEVCVVSSTHWDREWRFSFQQTRAMLVELMDNLLDILDAYPEFKYYHLDAQTVVLEDYLAIRPEKRETLEKFIKEGRIIVGPWYTLPELHSVGGEPIVRNLLLGHKIAKEFGKVMKVGYTPTGHGQIAQLPQVYGGFGINTILFYRGADRTILKKEFIWEAPDGSRATTYIFTPEYGRMSLFHCVASNYYKSRQFYDRELSWSMGEGAFRLDDDRTWKDLYYQSHPYEGRDKASLEQDIKKLIEVEMKDSVMDTFLIIDGVDSTEPQPLLIKLLEDMNKVASKHGVSFYHTTLEDFARKLLEVQARYEVYRGEMRTSAKYGVQVNLLGAGISSRIYLKQMNDNAERKLINWAEPFSVFSWTMGGDYPSRMLELAWKYLLWNQAHDSISGCSQDIVHADMEYYFRQIEEISDTILTKALFNITSNISGKAFTKDAVLLTVYNPLPYVRSETVKTYIDLPEGVLNYPIRIIGPGGEEVPLQVDSEPFAHRVLIHRPKDVPCIYKMTRLPVQFYASQVPPMGYKVFAVESCNTKVSTDEECDRGFCLENEYLSVTANAEDGTFNIRNLKTGRMYTNLNMFEDGGEVGDPWTRKVPKSDRIVRKPAGYPRISMTKGEITSSITVELFLEVPCCADADRRSEDTVELAIKTTASLAKGSPWVSFKTIVNNSVMDHRLRVLFPTGLDVEYSYAEAPFHIVKREIKARDTSGWFEQGYTTFPQRGFTAVTDGKDGLAILNKGLPEYEVIDDKDKTIAITLLRCYKMLIPKLKTVDKTQHGSQCLGEHVFEYAVLPFEGNSLLGIYEHSLAYRLPMKVAQNSAVQDGTLPLQQGLLEVSRPLILYAVKKAEQRDSIVLRLFNPSDRTVNG